MEFLKGIVLSLWTKHRKKVIALIMGLAFGALAALTGIPLSEIKDAAKDAASAPAPVEAIAPAPLNPVVPLPAPGK